MYGRFSIRSKFNKLLLKTTLSIGIISDILNGVLAYKGINFSIGVILRGSLELVAFYIIFFKKRIPTIYKFFLSFLIVLFLLTELKALLINSDIYFFYDLSKFLKLLYIPTQSILIYYILTNSTYSTSSILNLLATIGFIESLAVVIPTFSGISVRTYEISNLGYRGILLSPNEISLSLIIAYAINIWLFIHSRSKLYYIFLLTIILALILCSTRTSLFGSFLVPLFVIIISVMFNRKKQPSKVKKNKFRILLLTVLMTSITYYTINFIMNNKYIYNKVLMFLDSLNARGELQETGLSILANYSIPDLLMGSTMSIFFETVEKKGLFPIYGGIGKNVEVDWIDILGGLGLIFLYLIYTFYFIFLGISFKKFFLEKKKEHGLISFLLLAFLLHSLIAGHALMAPLPGNYIAPLIALVMVDSQRRR